MVECDHCNYRCKNASYLYEHMRRRHPRTIEPGRNICIPSNGLVAMIPNMLRTIKKLKREVRKLKNEMDALKNPDSIQSGQKNI